MAADSTKYGLVNTGLFTRSHCDCDTRFYQCLKEANSIVADSVGYTYFTILGPQCFKQDYPIIECLEEKGYVLYLNFETCSLIFNFQRKVRRVPDGS